MLKFGTLSAKIREENKVRVLEILGVIGNLWKAKQYPSEFNVLEGGFI